MATRDARAALYRKAVDGSDPALSQAVEAFWEERHRQSVGGGAGLQRMLEQAEAQLAAMSEEERAEHDRQLRIELAINPLIDAIYENTDQILGDS